MTDAQPKTLLTPLAHRRHTDGKACGCWDGQMAPVTQCRICGACYLMAETVEFPIWRCYDCGAGWRTFLEPQKAI